MTATAAESRFAHCDSGDSHCRTLLVAHCNSPVAARLAAKRALVVGCRAPHTAARVRVDGLDGQGQLGGRACTGSCDRSPRIARSGTAPSTRQAGAASFNKHPTGHRIGWASPGVLARPSIRLVLGAPGGGDEWRLSSSRDMDYRDPAGAVHRQRARQRRRSGTLFGGRVGARRRGEYAGQPRRLFIFEASVAGNFAGLVAAMGTVYRLGGYHGHVDDGVALTAYGARTAKRCFNARLASSRGVLRLQLGRHYRHERVAAEQQYVAKLKCLCKVGLGSVGVAATPAAEATASPGRAIERSGWRARTTIHAEVTAVDTSSAIAVDTHPMPTWSCSRSTGSRAGRRCNQSAHRT